MVNSNAYFYVEDSYYNSLDQNAKAKFDADLSSLAANFDNVIYPKMKDIFGDEWKPGIDNDDRITIFFTKTKENVGGYFNPNDEYNKENIIDGKSNEREMLYLNAVFVGNKRIESFLAHEFQHMITWYHKTKLQGINDDVWLNEARSEYASMAIGYDNDYSISNLKARVENFLANQTDSLLEWENKIYDYSSVNLFSQYLAENFGSGIFKKMIENGKVGIESVDASLKDLGETDTNFKKLFANWTIANYINNASFSSVDIYGYKNVNLSYNNFHFKPTNSYIINDEKTTIKILTTIKDWSSRYYEFKTDESNKTGKNIEIAFNGQDSGKFVVAYVLFNKKDIIKVDNFELDNRQDSKIYIKNFGKDVTSLVLIPISEKQESNLGNPVDSYSFSISATISEGNAYPDGSLLKPTNSFRIFFIEEGKKRWITSSAAFAYSGYKWENVVSVLPDELKAFEEGEDISVTDSKYNESLVKGSGPNVYFIEEGKKRWISDIATFILNNYRWENVIHISDLELSFYDDGQVISVANFRTNRSLVKGSGSAIFLIENGAKRWITSVKVFKQIGYKWEDVIHLPQSELELYPRGSDLN